MLVVLEMVLIWQKLLALGADAIAIGTGSMIALNCNKDIPESNFEKEMGVKAGELLSLPYRKMSCGCCNTRSKIKS